MNLKFFSTLLSEALLNRKDNKLIKKNTDLPKYKKRDFKPISPAGMFSGNVQYQKSKEGSDLWYENPNVKDTVKEKEKELPDLDLRDAPRVLARDFINTDKIDKFHNQLITLQNIKNSDSIDTFRDETIQKYIQAYTDSFNSNRYDINRHLKENPKESPIASNIKKHLDFISNNLQLTAEKALKFVYDNTFFTDEQKHKILDNVDKIQTANLGQHSSPSNSTILHPNDLHPDIMKKIIDKFPKERANLLLRQNLKPELYSQILNKSLEKHDFDTIGRISQESKNSGILDKITEHLPTKLAEKYKDPDDLTGELLYHSRMLGRNSNLSFSSLLKVLSNIKPYEAQNPRHTITDEEVKDYKKDILNSHALETKDPKTILYLKSLNDPVINAYLFDNKNISQAERNALFTAHALSSKDFLTTILKNFKLSEKQKSYMIKNIETIRKNNPKEFDDTMQKITKNADLNEKDIKQIFPHIQNNHLAISSILEKENVPESIINHLGLHHPNSNNFIYDISRRDNVPSQIIDKIINTKHLETIQNISGSNTNDTQKKNIFAILHKNLNSKSLSNQDLETIRDIIIKLYKKDPNHSQTNHFLDNLANNTSNKVYKKLIIDLIEYDRKDLPDDLVDHWVNKSGDKDITRLVYPDSDYYDDENEDEII